MKIKVTLSIIALISLQLIGCTKYETYPLERITADIVYDELDKNGTYAEWVVNDIYSHIPRGFNRISGLMLDVATDDAISTRPNPTIERLSKSQMTSNNNPDNNWNDAYTLIRKVNIFLNNIDRSPRDEETKAFWKAEVRFIRALHYFELAKRFGGVPILGDTYYNLTDKIKVERNSFQEVIDYINNECTAIQSQLRNDPIPDAFLGRITQGAAIALKSRALLYAASPLNNPDNNTSKWELAANAAQELINSGKFSLVSNINSLFTTRKNTEVILARQESQHFGLEKQNAPIGFLEPNFSNGMTSPTQNLVDAFPMLNGKSIQEDGSNYNAQSPYTNRDPRLANTVFFHGSTWLNQPVELFHGGKDRPETGYASFIKTKTGYYLKKFLGNFNTAANYSNVNHNFIIFRYAEILLNYAEAKNELNDQQSAYTQLINIRKRAGLQAGSNQLYGLKPNMNKDEMRKAIQLERRIELAFEEHRFWDLRRWKLAEIELNKSLLGMDIFKTGDNQLTFNVIPVDYVTFHKKAYLYPIPNNEIIANEGRIKQNPDW